MIGFWKSRSLQREADRARGRRDWPVARDGYAAVLARRPRLEPIWVQYGHALKESGTPAEAEAAYRRALALRETNADTHLQLGHLLLLLNRPSEALLAYCRALELDPGMLDTARAVLLLGPPPLPLLALTPLTLTTPDAAAEARAARLDRRLARRPDDAAARLERAVLLRLLGRAAEAEAEAAVILRVDRRSASALVLHWRLKHERVARRRQELLLEHGPAAAYLPHTLRFVALGTTGLCNASCIHCPTGKAATEAVPRVPMPMPLFEGIIRQIAELGLTIGTQLSLGLFGDGLVDPFVVQRVRLVRELLPEVVISVNTNGAAYNRQRHQALAREDITLALHVESLVPATYNELMQPLRLERVLPKVEELLADFRGKVLVSIPVSRLNRAELPAMQAWFEERHATNLGFDRLSSRCAEDRSVFERLALAPLEIRCSPVAVDDLIVDCDGKVLMCCQDFQRLEGIGDLARQSLVEVLCGPARRLVHDQFAAGRHEERQTCRRCYGDTALAKLGQSSAALPL